VLDMMMAWLLVIVSLLCVTFVTTEVDFYGYFTSWGHYHTLTSIVYLSYALLVSYCLVSMFLSSSLVTYFVQQVNLLVDSFTPTFRSSHGHKSAAYRENYKQRKVTK